MPGQSLAKSRPLAGRPAAAPSFPDVERTLENWTWILALLVLGLSTLEDGTLLGPRLWSQTFVLVIATLNVLIHRVLRRYLAPATRTFWHLVLTSVATTFLLLDNGTLDVTPDFVALTDTCGRVEYLNRAARELLGVGEQDPVQGLDLVTLRPLQERERVMKESLPVALRDGIWRGETTLMQPDGREAAFSQVILAHRGAGGRVRYLSTIARNISERKALEAQLLSLANRDPLTGMLNSRRFLEEVELLLAQSRRYGTGGALLFLDLDAFKSINDRWGHAAGDQVLRTLAEWLREDLRESDRIGRMGGDEFAVLLPQADADAATAIGQRMLDLLRHRHVAIGPEAVTLRASLGIAVFPEHGTTVKELLAHADTAMYRAKQAGKDSLQLHAFAAD